MDAPMLVRFFHPDLGERTGLRLGDTVFDVSAVFPTVSAWLQASVGRVDEAVAELRQTAVSAPNSFPVEIFDQRPSLNQPSWLPPVDHQEVWAAGVTYLRSRAARQEEALDGGDIYARVYEDPRPELFFKANGWRVSGPLGNVGIRSDARWNVPEPELALVLNPALEIAGLVIGNDMSSRDIEGANPLYLPQAKVYNASCALGPGILLGQVKDTWPEVGMALRIIRAGREVFNGRAHTNQIKRTLAELVEYLGRCLSFPQGAVLLSGTGIVPPDDFTLAEGDDIAIDIEGLGRLENRVIVV